MIYQSMAKLQIKIEDSCNKTMAILECIGTLPQSNESCDSTSTILKGIYGTRLILAILDYLIPEIPVGRNWTTYRLQKCIRTILEKDIRFGNTQRVAEEAGDEK